MPFPVSITLKKNYFFILNCYISKIYIETKCILKLKVDLLHDINKIKKKFIGEITS